MSELTEKDRNDLEAYEAIIEQDIDTWACVSKALYKIKQRKLYLITHKSFESYCEERWGCDNE